MPKGIPNYLSDYVALQSHLDEHLEGLSSYEKGRRFAHLCQRLFPHCEIGEDFGKITKMQDSHDGGVDLEAASNDDSKKMFLQTKFRVPTIDDLDQTFSKFSALEDFGLDSAVQTEFDFGSDAGTTTQATTEFALMTASRLENLLDRYLKSKRPSAAFALKLMADKRFHLIDGPKMISVFQAIYRKTHVLPSNFDLPLLAPPIRMGDVYIGVLACNTLKALYAQFGESLFIENIREWLGATSRKQKTTGTRQTPNQAIAATLELEPDRFLARNNGITFRSSHVSAQTDNGQHLLRLADASIVNGCQTTMAVVHKRDTDAQVLAKIVVTQDSWDIAHAANFQNEIERIQLELARDLRPQVVRKAADQAGVGFKSTEDEESAFAVLDVIYQQEVVYEEVRALFICLFSRSPNNVFVKNYVDLRYDLLNEFSSDPEREEIYEILFALHQATARAARAARDKAWPERVTGLFQRFWKEEKFAYRAFLAVTTVCTLLNKDIFGASIKYPEWRGFLSLAAELLQRSAGDFDRVFAQIFAVLATDLIKPDMDVADLLQTMYREVEKAKIENLMLKLGMITAAI